jgi:hypothetical protein
VQSREITVVVVVAVDVVVVVVVGVTGTGVHAAKNARAPTHNTTNNNPCFRMMRSLPERTLER